MLLTIIPKEARLFSVTMPRTLATARRYSSNQPRCREGGINHRKRLAHLGINPPRMTAPSESSRPRHLQTLEKIFEAAVAEARSDPQSLEDEQKEKHCDMDKEVVKQGEKKVAKKRAEKTGITKNPVAKKPTVKKLTAKKSLAKKENT